MSEENRTTPPESINSIIRATNILELYGKLNEQYLGVAEISRELKLNKTTSFRVVKTLEHQGWLIQDSPNGKYRLSPKLIILASSVTRTFSVDNMIQQEMKNLCDIFNEDIVLTAIIDQVAVCLERVKSKNALNIESRVGRSVQMLRGSTGKTLLAFLPQDQISKILNQAFPPTADGEQSRAELEQSLEKIRNERYCISCSEQDEGVCSVAVPIFDVSGQIVYSLAIVGEEKRIETKGVYAMLSALRASAERIEEGLYIDGRG